MAEGQVLGRLAAIVAKQVLLGQTWWCAVRASTFLAISTEIS
jgi:ribosomal protein L13